MKKILFNYFKKHLLLLVFITIVILLVTGAALLPPQLLRLIIDKYLDDGTFKVIIIIGILYFCSFLMINILNFIKEWLLNVIAQGIIVDSKKALIKKMHRLSYQTLNSLAKGQIESYLNNDVASIDALITSGVISMIIDCIKIMGILVSIFLFSPIFGLLALAILPFVFLVAWLMRNISFKQQLKMRKIEGDVNTKTLNIVDNAPTIKAYGIYETMDDEYEKTLQLHYNATKKSNLCDAVFAPIMQSLRAIVITLIIIISAKDVYLGLSIGAVVACIDYISDLFKPIENLGMELTTLQKSLAGIKRLSDFLQLEEDEPKKTKLGNSATILFENVSFAYEKDEQIINHLSLQINRDEKYLFTGSSGVGKSTIFKLIVGIMKTTGGRLTIGDVESYYLDEEGRKQAFSILFQNPFFLHKSMREEISLLDSAMTDDGIWEALKSVGLRDRIVSLDQRFDDLSFSSGEQMLINLARLVSNPHPIILIDELNSQIDQLTLHKIISVLEQLSQGRIIICISHYGQSLHNSHVLDFDAFKSRYRKS